MGLPTTSHSLQGVTLSPSIQPAPYLGHVTSYLVTSSAEEDCEKQFKSLEKTSK